ncbi:hypothetical protein [Nitrosomonas sp. Nm132]|uniref:DUF4760 domain-containing protein n=1 Tax=Nitrosomonas sp. Nm132 TaxID=1881053 RepID=UPI000888B2E2|nr:hypothetical protein [Nitrosomonas sp. Nm132]SDH96999.1 hypothetical protein SAMN05428952_10519 [Nitrosomonas sp. Nm132]
MNHIDESTSDFHNTVNSYVDFIICHFDKLITDKWFYINILFAATIYCLLLIFWRPAAKVISFIFLRPFNRTISQYFASANTLLFISFVWFFVAIVVSHQIWIQDGKIDSVFVILGGGAAIASYFLNSGIKLHTEMRDHAIVLIREIKKPCLQNALKEVNKYFHDIRNGRSEKEWKENKLKEQDIKMLSSNKELINNITLVANYFEEVAISIRHRAAQETLLEVTLLHPFIDFYKNIEKFYIPHIRDIASKNTSNAIANKIFSNMDYLYHRWCPLNDKTTNDFSKLKNIINIIIVMIGKLTYLALLIFFSSLILWFFSLLWNE